MHSSINPEWVGYFAAFFTTTAYIPQLIKVLRERHTQSISVVMYCFLLIGISSWVVFGWLIESPSVILANSLCFLMALAILLIKLKHG